MNLPPLGCFGAREGKTSKTQLGSSWSGGNSSATTPISRVSKPVGTLARRPTPTTGASSVPSERAFLRGGAREQPSLATASRGFGSTLERPEGAGRMGAGRVGVREQVGSRGTLSGTGRATPTPPQRATGRAGRAVQHTTPDRSTPPASMAASCSSHGPTAAGPATAPPAASSSGGNAVCEKCDACDGKHSTDKCPWFKGKARDKHPDAKRASEKKMLGMQSGPVEVLRHGSARVVRQPGDGSCLFHSMCHGLKDGSSASSLRREVAAFISENPSLMISDSPLKDWVLWDSGSSVGAYSRKMAQGGVWGGGIEMAAVSHMRRVNVFVYQQSGSGFKRISSFESPGTGVGGKTKNVRVLYGGGVHYDALDATEP